MKGLWRIAVQLSLLTVVHLVGFVVAANLADVQTTKGPAKAQPENLESAIDSDNSRTSSESVEARQTRQQQEMRLFGIVMAVCFLNSAALLFWIQRLTLRGPRMALLVFGIFLACLTIMPQSETWFFFRDPDNILRVAGIMGLVVCAMFSVAAMFLMGRGNLAGTGERANVFLSPGRILGSIFLYVTLYLLFGYFVAWQNPELRTLYGGDSPDGFLNHVLSATVLTKLLPFQLLRGLIWTGICYLMLRFAKPGITFNALAVAAVIAIVMNAQLLIPNPLMPESVRLTHFAETAVSNLLFGFACAMILQCDRTALSKPSLR